MNKIRSLIFENSKETKDGIEIDYKDINKVFNELNRLFKQDTADCVLHMLNYCMENIGNKNTDIKKELDLWIENNQ